MRQAARHLDEDLELAAVADRIAALDDRRKVLAGQVLLDDVRNVALVAEVVHNRDVGMVERADDLRLAHEALAQALVVGGAGLDRDDALDVRIPALVDRAEAAFAEDAGDLEVGQPRADRQAVLRAARDCGVLGAARCRERGHAAASGWCTRIPYAE